MYATEESSRRGGLRQATAGLLLMAAGVVLLLDQLGLIEIGTYWRYWPLVLIVVGTVKLVAPRRERDIPGGTTTLLWGCWFLACSLHWGGLTFANSWPLTLVILGVGMIVRALVRAGGNAADGKEVPHA